MRESQYAYTSQHSLYNYDRKEFRKRRGEDISESPGDKAKWTQEIDSVPLDVNGKKRRGSQMGHTGISHHNKATRAPLYYTLDPTCPHCGSSNLVYLEPICKMFYDIDESYRM